ncbi:MAG TPA: SDR family oxidoreductase [Draconibacterium sp.]|nr:SDR family oxidoreductase [Draconibacterium sp.]
MKCLITGATGFIGNRLAEELLKPGNEVHVLARSKQKVSKLFGNRVTFFGGDLWETQVINEAANNCDVIFHLAAFANIWSKDKMLAYKTNVEGTKNILDAALQNKVKKVVFTSSVAILPPAEKDEKIDETAVLPEKFMTDYETTKFQAEQLCAEYCRKGLDVVIVNPSRVFGPGLLNKSNSVTILIKKYIAGNWRLIPGNGNAIGNYVYIDDVVKGHILAMERGIAGEKYILGGTNISFNGFFETISKVSGKNHRLVHLPFSIILIVSKFELFLAETTGKKPMITPPWAKKYLQNRPVSSKKAKMKLNYTVTQLDEGIRKTIEWLKTEQNGK